MKQILKKLALLREAVFAQATSTDRTIMLSQITCMRLALQLDAINACLSALDEFLTV